MLKASHETYFLGVNSNKGNATFFMESKQYSTSCNKVVKWVQHVEFNNVASVYCTYLAAALEQHQEI